MKRFFILQQDKQAPDESSVQAHRDHLESLRTEGILLYSGSFVDYKGNMQIIQAADKKAALVIALSDPYIREGFKTFKMYEFTGEE